jgi:hypothetical protein
MIIKEAERAYFELILSPIKPKQKIISSRGKEINGFVLDGIRSQGYRRHD